MKIYPAIDVMAGQVVRLAQGRFDDKTVYDGDPVALARRYAAAGAGHLHLVDLDGARAGHPVHGALITRVARTAGVRVQVGGGVRGVEHVTSLLAAGADRVVLGSLAVKDPALTRDILARVGPERVTLAVDVRIDEGGVARVATHGWQRAERVAAPDLIAEYRGHGVGRVLCTDIARDGAMAGPNLALYRELAGRFDGVEILASGGVASLDDVRALAGAGVAGVIIGKALLEGAFTVEEALAC